jgi:hypothetical protein
MIELKNVELKNVNGAGILDDIWEGIQDLVDRSHRGY